jgi:hypothetical protein
MKLIEIDFVEWRKRFDNAFRTNCGTSMCIEVPQPIWGRNNLIPCRNIAGKLPIAGQFTNVANLENLAETINGESTA